MKDKLAFSIVLIALLLALPSIPRLIELAGRVHFHMHSGEYSKPGSVLLDRASDVDKKLAFVRREIARRIPNYSLVNLEGDLSEPIHAYVVWKNEGEQGCEVNRREIHIDDLLVFCLSFIPGTSDIRGVPLAKNRDGYTLFGTTEYELAGDIINFSDSTIFTVSRAATSPTDNVTLDRLQKEITEQYASLNELAGKIEKLNSKRKKIDHEKLISDVAKEDVPKCKNNIPISSFDGCKRKIKYEDGSTFDGEFRNGEPIKGTMTYVDGSVYVGELLNGLHHGLGNFKFGAKTDAFGDSYEGEFYEGFPHGRGTHTFGPNHSENEGDKYQGDFVKGEMTGQGTYLWKNGDKYVGSYKNGRRNGRGTFFDAVTGDKYTGEWLDGKRHGVGVLSYGFTGTEIKGEWEDDVRITDPLVQFVFCRNKDPRCRKKDFPE